MNMSREDEYTYTAQALPTPTDTPYRTPARSLSRRSSRHSSRHCNSSPGPSSSPPPFPPSGDSYFRNHGGSKDYANDETISILDPRRFTPTLHASLVSEILSLRRDLESKTSLIENLESSLHTAKIENETITETLSRNAKENRALERQLQALEGGSSSAFGELAKERDEALTSLSDVRQRLEVSQARIRSQEEEGDRTHALWERDRQTWDGERRKLERKVHVVEGRLKTVLAEIAAAEANGPYHGGDFDAEGAVENHGFEREGDRTSIRASSALDRRPTSGMSNSTHDGDAHNIRLSMLSGPNGYGGVKASGLTLADELGFDEEEEDMLDDNNLEDGRVSPDALPEERLGRMSALSVSREDQKARKVLGLPPEREFAIAKAGEPLTTEKTGISDGGEDLAAVLELRYTDIGVQYSPTPSPGLKIQTVKISGDDAHEDGEPARLENGPNQSRKRVSVSAILPVDQCKDLPSLQRSITMVSSPSQTFDDLPCPGCIYKEALENVVTSRNLRVGVGEMRSSSTQTEDSRKQQTTAVLSSTDSSTSQLVPVPTITVHPPVSAPSSPRNSVVLPPHTKSTACQASLVPAVKLRSISVQTEEIRIDNRAIKLPEKLRPSAISSQPPTPQLRDIEDDGGSPTSHDAIIKTFRTSLQNPPPDRAPPPRPVGYPVEPNEAYPGNNDNGPLDSSNSAPIRRPFRSSSLFAGFDIPSDEADEKAEADLSDDDFRNAAPIRKTLSKVENSWKLVPKKKEHLSESRDIPEVDEEVEKEHDHTETEGTSALDGPHARSAGWGPSAISQPSTKPSDSTPRWGSIAKQPDIRKTALISSGTAAHLQRSRSPSLPSTSSTVPTTAAPPFPVPTRLSSRKIPLSASDGAQSPTPYSGGAYPGDRRRESGRPPAKKSTMRKVRSAAAFPRGGHDGRSHSQSPPPKFIPSAVPESPKLPRLPPMPTDDNSSSGYRHTVRPYQHEQQYSTSNSDAGNTVIDTSVQQTTVVDAIAQTMVGEWMWKYVRKRKSFGVSESPQADWEVGRNIADGSASVTGSGIRHKRWVWLAPYERAVMWSSKQPTSESALLGKSGRKCKLWYISMTRKKLTSTSDDPIGVGCQRRHSISQRIKPAAASQSVDLDINPTACAQVHSNVQGTSLLLAYCPLVSEPFHAWCARSRFSTRNPVTRIRASTTLQPRHPPPQPHPRFHPGRQRKSSTEHHQRSSVPLFSQQRPPRMDAGRRREIRLLCHGARTRPRRGRTASRPSLLQPRAEAQQHGTPPTHRPLSQHHQPQRLHLQPQPPHRHLGRHDAQRALLLRRHRHPPRQQCPEQPQPAYVRGKR